MILKIKIYLSNPGLPHQNNRQIRLQPEKYERHFNEIILGDDYFLKLFLQLLVGDDVFHDIRLKKLRGVNHNLVLGVPHLVGADREQQP